MNEERRNDRDTVITYIKHCKDGFDGEIKQVLLKILFILMPRLILMKILFILILRHNLSAIKK